MFRLIKLLACLHAASRDVFFRPRSEVEPRTPGQLRRRTAVWVRAVLAVARRTRAHPVAGLRPARAAPRHDARSDRRRLWPAVARSRRLRSAPGATTYVTLRERVQNGFKSYRILHAGYALDYSVSPDSPG